MDIQSWTVSDAKTHLSEILRRARLEGPQQIGAKQPCILVPIDEWERLTADKPRLGSWLAARLAGVGELELPSRFDDGRPPPFGDEA